MTPLYERLRGAPIGDEDPALFSEVRSYVSKVAAAMFRTRRLVPTHGGKPTSDDVHDVVTDFFLVPGRVADVAIRATSEKHFKWAVELTLARLQVDAFRGTELGNLRKRTTRRLTDRPDMTAVNPKHWALLDYAAEAPWAGGPEPLEEAAARVHIDPPSAPTASGQRPMATSTKSLDETCDAILVTAAAPVAASELLSVVGRRILPGDEYSGLLSPADAPDDDSVADPSAPTGAGTAVGHAIWDTLDDEERLLLRELWVPSRTLADEGLLTLKKSALSDRQVALAEKLRCFLEGLDELTEAAACLLNLAGAHAAGQDPKVGP